MRPSRDSSRSMAGLSWRVIPYYQAGQWMATVRRDGWARVGWRDRTGE